VIALMHKSSPLILVEEVGLSGDLTGRSSGQRGGCDRMMRSGGGSDLSSGKS
jgi:hypothetical protein